MSLTLPAGQGKGPLEFSLTSSESYFRFGLLGGGTSDFEIPSHIDLGSHEVSVMHQFPGGRRVIQTFGRVPPEHITWEGIVFGPNSFQRAQELQVMVSPLTTTLKFGPFKYAGILKDVTLKPLFEGYVPYHATFDPTADVSDNADLRPNYDTQSQALLDAQIAAGQAQLACSVAQSAILLVQSAIVGTALTAMASPTSFVGAIVTLTNANSIVFNFLSTTTNASDAVLAVALYSAVEALLTAAAGTSVANSIFLTVDSPNLFLLAARYYGDSGQWGTISAANNSIPPLGNTGTVTLVIPLANG